jgi:sterol 3beta-glucosyltransferase
MKILILTLGTRGDIQPYIALAKELQLLGHLVTIGSHPYMRKWTTFYKVNFTPIGPDLSWQTISTRLGQLGMNWIRALTNLSQSILPLMESVSSDLLALFQQYDFIILPPSSFGKVEADYLGLNHACVINQPQAIQGLHYQNTPILNWLEKVYVHFTDRTRLTPYNKFRKKFGLQPLQTYRQLLSPTLNFFPISQYIIDRPAHWTTIEHITGYWFLDSPRVWQPPRDLATFIETGLSPVMISLGAMEQNDQSSYDILRIFIKAVIGLGLRGVIQTRYPEAYENLNSKNIFFCGDIPHDWLLPKMRCIIHHCGFGTTAAGLRAGIPAVALPFVLDQHFWANRLHLLGVSPPPLNYKKLELKSATRAIELAYYSDFMWEKALNFGKAINQERGALIAAKIIDGIQ